MPIIKPFLPGCVESCPACPHRNLSMEESLLQKYDWLKSRLLPFAEVLQQVRSVEESKRLGYRDKVCLHAEFVHESWKIGIRKRGEVVSIPDCPVHKPQINALIRDLMNQLPSYICFPLIYYVHSGSQLALVLKSSLLPPEDILQWLKRLINRHPSIEGLWIHLHPSAGYKVFGKGGWHLIQGKPYSVDESGLRYGPAAFQQLLPELYQQALDESERFLTLSENSLIVDLYSGTGSSIRRWMDKRVGCIGVEISGDAIRQAEFNVQEVTVLRGTGKQRIPQLNAFITQNNTTADQKYLYANPPRTGLENEVTEWIITRYRPQKIAYLSCSAGTLRRDLDRMNIAGYRINHLIPFDFFPQTRHVEVLSLLELL